MKSFYEINKHLFYQFDFELAGADVSQVKDNFPFEVELFGEVVCKGKPCCVYSFSFKQKKFISIENDQILRVDAKFSINDLQNKILGEEWIYSQKPINLNTTDFTDESLPSATKRREILETLCFSAFNELKDITILESYYLKKSGETIGLVRNNKTSANWMIASCFDPIEIKSKVYIPDNGISFELAKAIGTSLIK